MTNFANNVLYVGVTNNLVKRVYEHKNKFVEGFIKKYNVTKLVYYEICNEVECAITREKQIKAGSRRKKLEMIIKNNPNFKDLYEKII